MPLYRTYEDGYCNVRHPKNGETERMYKATFREAHGYVPVWPRVVHHDIFRENNPNPKKTNDDPRYLVEMGQKEHFLLHSQTAKERLRRGEIWGARAHKLYPEMYSKMASENMLRLHADPAFQVRHARRMSETNRKVRERGGYKEANAQAGSRGAPYLTVFNRSPEGRAQSSVNGKKNTGRKHTEETKFKMRGRKHTEETRRKMRDRTASSETRQKMSQTRREAAEIVVPCPHCDRLCKGYNGLKSHLRHSHNNHKVVAVRPLLECADVYCLTVDKYANFALNAGVFAHNCGMLLMRVDGLSAGSFKNRYQRERWVKAVEKCIAMGVGSHRPEGMPSFSERELIEIMKHGAIPLGADPNTCERSHLPVAEGTDFKGIPKAWGRALPQLGSLGGGNHFVELQGDTADGSLWVMLHSGSRGYGYQTAEHFFYAAAGARGLPSNQRERAWLRADEPLGKQYWALHNSAANYAIANRHTMAASIRRVFQDEFDADCTVHYEISHNLIQEETLVLPDGTTTRGFVHRKGATRAMPAGHPDLVGTTWAETGHPIIVPGSMYEGAAVLRPQPGAHAWACSVNHGSGRILARGAAKRKLGHKQLRIDDEMREVKRRFGPHEVEGIVGNTKHVPLDECQHVYKSLDEVLRVLESSGVASVERRLYPLANLKGTD